MKLTKNISREEVACKCRCGFDSIDFKVVEVVQDCCDHFAEMLKSRVILTITSACRCKAHNSTVGGKQKSQHVLGRAMDIQLRLKGGQAISPADVSEYIQSKNPHSLGVGTYATFTHVDSRGARARW